MPARRQRWRWAWSGSWWSSGTSRGRAETRKAGPADGPSDDEESHGKTRSGSYATSPQATHARRPGTLPTAEYALPVDGETRRDRAAGSAAPSPSRPNRRGRSVLTALWPARGWPPERIALQHPLPPMRG